MSCEKCGALLVCCCDKTQYKQEPPVNLHLGCGKRKLPGWVSVDSRESTEPDVVADVRNLDAWQSGGVGQIYASHVLEHIPRPDLLATLREWRRVLKPGGKLRVSVPDFATLAALYHENGVSFWRIVGPLYGRQDYAGNTHYIGFDYEYLSWLLTEAGFYNVKKWAPASWLPDGYDDYSLARINGYLISLCVEATA